MRDYTIKTIDATGLAEAVCLIRRVFTEFVAPDCSSLGVKKFATFLGLKKLRDELDRSEIVFWGAYDSNDNLAGVIAGQTPGHIKYLFVEKRCQHQGLARQLVGVLRNHYRASGGCVLTVNSSLYAREVYEKLGFRDIGPEKIVDGIRFIPMAADI